MNYIKNFTAIIEREDDKYVFLCNVLDVASQGDTEEEAKANLQQAIELFCEHAPKEEIATRLFAIKAPSTTG